MTNEQLAVLLKNQIRLLKSAFDKADEGLCGVERHKVLEFIGAPTQMLAFNMSGLTAEEHEAKNPMLWSEEAGTAVSLDPIKEEIAAMEAYVEALENNTNQDM